MNKCNKCGNELQKGAIICRSCGQRFIGVPSAGDTVSNKQKKAKSVREEKMKVKEKSKAPAESRVKDDVASVQENVQKKAVISNDSVLTTGNFISMYVLQLIPCVNIIMLFIWAFGKSSNLNKRNYARAQLIVAVIALVLIFTLYAVLGATLLSTFSGMI
ncbi:MAG: zinc ribbon domain-containing protein [Alphaproteobacteria bacterium]|nr:zinc ribbon domain-containing protein [Alphaproteobacteria bacterium]